VPVYWVKADKPCGSLYWQIVFVDSIAVTVPVKFLSNEQNYLLLISYTGKKIIIILFYFYYYIYLFIYLFIICLFVHFKQRKSHATKPAQNIVGICAS